MRGGARVPSLTWWGRRAGWDEAGSADSPGSVVAAAVARQRPRQSARGRGRVRRTLRGRRAAAAAAVRLPPPSRLRATDGAAGGMTGNSWARAAKSKYEHRSRASVQASERASEGGPRGEPAEDGARCPEHGSRQLPPPAPPPPPRAPALQGGDPGAEPPRSLHLGTLRGVRTTREPRTCGVTCPGGDGMKSSGRSKDGEVPAKG